MEKDEYVTARQAAKILGCTHRNVNMLVQSGRLRSERRKTGPGWEYNAIRLADVRALQAAGSRRGRPRKEISFARS